MYKGHGVAGAVVVGLGCAGWRAWVSVSRVWGTSWRALVRRGGERRRYPTLHRAELAPHVQQCFAAIGVYFPDTDGSMSHNKQVRPHQVTPTGAGLRFVFCVRRAS